MTFIVQVNKQVLLNRYGGKIDEKANALGNARDIVKVDSI